MDASIGPALTLAAVLMLWLGSVIKRQDADPGGNGTTDGREATETPKECRMPTNKALQEGMCDITPFSLSYCHVGGYRRTLALTSHTGATRPQRRRR